VIITFSCKNKTDKSENGIDYKKNTIQVEQKERHTIIDSIHPNGNFKVELFADLENKKNKFNSIFKLYSKTTDNYKLIYSDSIFTTIQEILFEDYNQDNIEDILIRNIFDVRSNSTFYLYIIAENGTVKRILNFEKIKNPKYLSEYDVISNLVMSGKNWTSFYEIKNDSIREFSYVIYSDGTDVGEKNYEAEYKKALLEIGETQKN